MGRNGGPASGLPPEIEQCVAAMADALSEVVRTDPGLQAEEFDTARPTERVERGEQRQLNRLRCQLFTD